MFSHNYYLLPDGFLVNKGFHIGRWRLCA